MTTTTTLVLQSSKIFWTLRLQVQRLVRDLSCSSLLLHLWFHLYVTHAAKTTLYWYSKHSPIKWTFTIVDCGWGSVSNFKWQELSDPKSCMDCCWIVPSNLRRMCNCTGTPHIWRHCLLTIHSPCPSMTSSSDPLRWWFNYMSSFVILFVSVCVPRKGFGSGADPHILLALFI